LWFGNIQEIVLYPSDQSSNRGLIEDNINGYYNIFTHSLDSGSGYVTRWYDQSGNDRHATQITSSRQPQIISSGSVILENNKPSIRFDFNKKTLLDAGDFSSLTEAESFLLIKSYMEGLSRNDFIDFGSSTSANHYPFNNIIYDDFGSTVRKQTGVPVQPVTQLNIYGVTTKPNLWQSRINLIPQFQTNSNTVGFRTNAQIGQDNDSFFFRGWISELTIYPADQSSNRIGITSNINTYFNVYTQPVYNQNSNSLSLYSNPTTVAGAANNVASASFTTGGPLGLITVSRTGSSNYTLWKNRVPNKVTTSPSVPQSTELYLNAANLNNSLFSASQNNIAYASVGAGLTDDEVYTYYELVDELQTELGRGVTDPNAFITTWDTRITGTGTVTGTSSIALPLYGTQAITASWGDGIVSLISQSAQVDRTHSYAEPGIYTVSITGTGQGFQFANGGDRNKLIDVGQWGSIEINNYAFQGCQNLVGSAGDGASNVKGLTYVFNGSNIRGNLNKWNVSGVSGTVSRLFYSGQYNQPLNDWDVSNITGWDTTFIYSPFNQNIGRWNVSKVTSFSNIFYGSGFNNGGSPDINNWQINTSSNVDMDSMFVGNSAFNQPIGNWNTSRVINMASMFGRVFSNPPFNQNIGTWNVERVTNMSNMFRGPFNNGGSPSINNWRPISCSNFSGMFYNATAFNQPIGNWPLSASSINMSSMFRGSSFNQNIGAWDVSRVTNMGGMFQDNGGFNNSGSSDINNWRPISCSNFSSMFYNAPAFNQPIGSWPISASNISMGYMFAFASSFNQYIGSWDVSNVTSMTNMFNNADAFNQNIGAWNVEKVTNMSSMFNGNRDFNNSGSSDINNWRPISCSNFSSMFQSATAFNQPIGNWPLSASNINMSSMFQSATAFNQDIGAWDTSNVLLMNGMFDFNTSFNQDIGSWDTSAVTNMQTMFRNATSFNQNIGSWDVGAVTNMTSMFNGATAFNNDGSSDINNWDTSAMTNMQYMFNAATAFNQDIGLWNTSAVTTMQGMFNSATAFNQNIGSWDVSTVTTMASMFNSSGIDIPNYTKTLRGWGNLANTTGVQTAVPLGASGKKYGAAHAQRKVLTDTYGWTITDSGQEPFIFTINTTASSYNPGTELTFQLPILDANTGSYALDILVNWGDSSVSSISSSNQSEIQHTYSNSGSYEITVTGSLTGFRFNNGGDKAKVTDVSKWSALEINTAGAFFGCSNLTSVATDVPFISTTSLRDCFQNAVSFTGDSGMENWDVSGVGNMQGMFASTAFDQNIGGWDVSNVSIMTLMFIYNSAFNNGGSDSINNWDTSNVTSMYRMFESATGFNQDIGNWNVSSVTGNGLERFMLNKSTVNYNHLDSIYNNWPNYKLQPNLTASFGSIEYTPAASESRNLLTRPYASASISNLSENGGNFQIQANAHGLLAGNRCTITGSDNAVLNKAHTVTSVPDPNSFVIAVPFTASANQGFVYTGYNWNITDGGPV
jgi:surface protein